MVKPFYTLLDNFELKGIWWLPDQPKKQISGILSFDNEKEIILKLIGAFYKIKCFKIGNSFQAEIILGVTDNGKLCTLLENIETGHQFSIPGIQKSIIKSRYLLIGKHFNTPDEICFSSFQANFTNLENWLAKHPFSMEVPNDVPNNVKNSEWKLTYKWPSEFTVKVKEINSSIESTHEFKTDGDLIRNAIWESKAYLRIIPNDPKDLKWYWDIIYNLCNFLTLLIGETTYITYVKGFNGDIEIRPGQKKKESIELFFTQNKPRINEGIHTFEMIIPFPCITDKIDSIISLWFSKCQNLRSVYDLFFGTFYNPSMYLEFHFLSLIQALESFHRATKGGKYLCDEDWKPYKERLTNAISVELDSGHRESIKNRIKYGNEYSLRKRLGELLKTLDKETLSVLFPSVEYFTKYIVDTRNYLSHYDNELKNFSLKGADLYWANQRLRVFITILLLKEIGIEEDVILESMKKNNKNSQIFKKRHHVEQHDSIDIQKSNEKKRKASKERVIQRIKNLFCLIGKLLLKMRYTLFALMIEKRSESAD